MKTYQELKSKLAEIIGQQDADRIDEIFQTLIKSKNYEAFFIIDAMSDKLWSLDERFKFLRVTNIEIILGREV